MTAPFPSLLRFYFRALYGLSGGAARRAAGPGDPAARRAAAKRALKTLGVAVLALVVAADLGVLFGASYAAMYRALAPAGLQDLLLLNAASGAAAVAFVLGFVTALSTYCLSAAEGALLAMPIPPRSLFGAKFAMTYLADLAIAFLMMAVAAVVYGLGERPPAAFYACAFLTALATPLVPLAIAYLLLVPLMSASRVLRDKNAVMLAGGLLGLAAALAVNLYFQSMMSRIADPAWIVAAYAGPEALLSRLGRAYPPAGLAAAALSRAASGGSLAGLGGAALVLLAGLAVAWGAVALLGPAYAASLPAFGEGRLKRLASPSDFLARTLRRSRPGRSLFLREWRLMNREPVYFLNGPSVVFLMPVIAGVALAASPEGFAAAKGAAASLGGPYPALAAAAFGAFLGGTTSVPCTALSRDGRALPYLKALPIGAGALMLAKFLHAFAFSAIGAATGAAGALPS